MLFGTDATILESSMHQPNIIGAPSQVLIEGEVAETQRSQR